MRLDYARKRANGKPPGYGLVAAIVVILVLCGLSPIFQAIADRNTVYVEVDINSGRIRHVRHFLRVDFDEHVQDTVLTKALCLPPGNITSPQWIRGGYFVHYANYQIQELADLWHDKPFTADAKRNIATLVLRMWQERGDYYTAGKYIEAVSEAADAIAWESPRAIDVADLPAAKRRIW